jgi:hypothetical protein
LSYWQVSMQIRDVTDLEGAFRTAGREQADTMYVLPSPTFAHHRERLAELERRQL